MESTKIVFYDGDCGFCNRAVSYVLKRDTSNSLEFSSLQSSHAKKFFEQHNFEKPDLSTFYFYENGSLYERSTAALKVIKYFSWYHQWMRLGWICPRFVRDGVYDFIAKRRRKISKGYCDMPSEEEMKRFHRQSS